MPPANRRTVNRRIATHQRRLANGRVITVRSHQRRVHRRAPGEPSPAVRAVRVGGSALAAVARLTGSVAAIGAVQLWRTSQRHTPECARQAWARLRGAAERAWAPIRKRHRQLQAWVQARDRAVAPTEPAWSLRAEREQQLAASAAGSADAIAQAQRAKADAAVAAAPQPARTAPAEQTPEPTERPSAQASRRSRRIDPPPMARLGKRERLGHDRTGMWLRGSVWDPDLGREIEFDAFRNFDDQDDVIYEGGWQPSDELDASVRDQLDLDQRPESAWADLPRRSRRD